MKACLFSLMISAGLITRLSLIKMQADHFFINSFHHLLLACQMWICRLEGIVVAKLDQNSLEFLKT